jgi:hypothetical protein
MIPLSAMISAAAPGTSSGRSYRTRAVLRASSIWVSLQPRPRAAVVMAVRSSPASAATVSAAPSAVPESPAAGCTQISLNGLSASSLVLATQFRATRSKFRPIDGLGAEAAVWSRMDPLPKMIKVQRRPVRGHGHHLVLVAGSLEAEMGGRVLVQQSERVWQRLGREDVQLVVAILPRQHRGGLASAVDREHRAVSEGSVWTPGCSQRCGGGVRDMVPYEMKRLAVITGQGGPEELGRASRVRGAQVLPTRVERSGTGIDQRWIVGIRDRIKIIRSQSTFRQAPPDRLLGQFPRGEGHRTLAVLAAG